LVLIIHGSKVSIANAQAIAKIKVIIANLKGSKEFIKKLCKIGLAGFTAF